MPTPKYKIVGINPIQTTKPKKKYVIHQHSNLTPNLKPEKKVKFATPRPGILKKSK